jgi:hypothetical protein
MCAAGRGGICCEAFSFLLADAGVRGLSAIVTKGATGFSFLLQCRGVDYRDMSKLAGRPIAIDVSINVSGSVVIRHCPFCGENLRKLAKRAEPLLARLAIEHEPYDDRILAGAEPKSG